MTAAAKKRKPRPLPPLPPFSLNEVADDSQLAPKDVAGFKRQSLSWTEKCRLDKSDGLDWVYVDGSPRCIAGSLKVKLAGSTNKPPPPFAAKAPAKRRAAAGAGAR